MSRLEEALARRWSGARIMIASAGLGAAGILPILLYGLFGPRDGNPIGLGLLAMAAVPLAGIGIALGALKLVVDLLVSRKR